MSVSKRLVILLLVAAPLLAQVAPPSDVTGIIKQFQAASMPWLTVGEEIATTLFGSLIAIELGITIGMFILTRADISQFGAMLTRKFLVIGAFYTLLLLGPTYMQWLVDKYIDFGAQASGVPSITAGDIMADGLQIIGNLLSTAFAAGLGFKILESLVMVCCAMAIGWGFCKLVKGFVMAKIESFVTIYVSVIQLGWGALRFTSIYAERYVAAAMATGIKLMVFYFIIGIERALAPAWIEMADHVAFDLIGVLKLATMASSIVVFCALADPEKLAANIFAGQPQFTGHDITNTYMPYVNTSITMATTAAGIAIGAATGGGGIGALLAGRVASGGGGGNYTSPPPPPPAPPRPQQSNLLPPPSPPRP